MLEALENSVMALPPFALIGDVRSRHLKGLQYLLPEGLVQAGVWMSKYGT
jgi:hypothetical protein